MAASATQSMCRCIEVAAFGPSSVLKLVERALPETIPAKSVLVRVMAAGVNPVDTYIRSGSYGMLPTLPYVPGKDGAGIVVGTGEGSQWHSGDRVFVSASSGLYASFAVLPDVCCQPLPAHVSFAEGAALGVPYATAYRALFLRARARPGSCVLVHGASGAVGTATVQLARAAGMRVLGTSSSDRGRVLAEEAGCHEVFDHGKEGYMQQVLAATGGRGVDVVVEMLANKNLGEDLRVLARGGCVAIVGSRGVAEVNPRDLMSREASVVGVMLGGATDDERKETHAALAAGLLNRTLKPQVGQRFALRDASSAHDYVLEQPGGAMGKVVLLPWEGEASE